MNNQHTQRFIIRLLMLSTIMLTVLVVSTEASQTPRLVWVENQPLTQADGTTVLAMNGVPLIMGKNVHRVLDEDGEPILDTNGFPALMDDRGRMFLLDRDGYLLLDGSRRPVTIEKDIRPMLDSGKRPVLDMHGHPLLVSSDGRMLVLDRNGLPIRDQEGRMVLVRNVKPMVKNGRMMVDAYGRPMLVDFKGRPVVVESDGSFLQVHDDGRPVVDERGEPLITTLDQQ